MPLYEYLCKVCGVLEVHQSINDAPLKTCPTCDKKIEKIMSVPSSPQFKGKGFYETDYKKKT